MGNRQKVLKAIRAQAWGFVEWLVAFWPEPSGSRLRYLYWKCRLRRLGKDVRFGVGVRIYAPEWVSIGNHCWIDDYVIIIAGPVPDDGRFVYRKANPRFPFQEGEVVIGDYVHIAPYVLLQGHGGISIGNCLGIAAGSQVYALSHHYRDLTGKGDLGQVWKFAVSVSNDQQTLICSPVVIEDDAAVGLNCVILPGSIVGKGTWLGAMSLLRGELPSNVIASGIPATIVKERFR